MAVGVDPERLNSAYVWELERALMNDVQLGRSVTRNLAMNSSTCAGLNQPRQPHSGQRYGFNHVNVFSIRSYPRVRDRLVVAWQFGQYGTRIYLIGHSLQKTAEAARLSCTLKESLWFGRLLHRLMVGSGWQAVRWATDIAHVLAAGPKGRETAGWSSDIDRSYASRR